MAAPDELQLRRLGPEEWPEGAAGPSVLAPFLHELKLPRSCGLAWRSGALSAAVLLERAAILRRAGRIAAVLVPADELAQADLDQLDGGVPLLIVFTPTARRPFAAWEAIRSRLSRLRSATLRFAFAGVAPCHLLDSRGDLRVRLIDAPLAKRQPAACAPCAAVGSCAGPGDVAAGSGGVRPLPRPISNQFDLVERPLALEGPTATATAAACPPAELATSAGGDVLLLDEGKWRWFAPDAGDWAADALEHAVDDLGQVYLDVSRKARLDDFAADLVALERHHPPHESHVGPCQGAWRRRQAQPFAAEERDLRAELAALHGTIVDVGAGPIRYTRAFAAALAAGRLRYIAVEPDPAALHRSAAGLPGGIWLRGVGERLPLSDGLADAIILLRSYNHLRHVSAALGEARRVLRPGGTLLLVDNVGFGLARTRTQLMRARAVPLKLTPFEHYRDHNAIDAVEELRRVGGFAVELIRSVGPDTSNQWLVRARRDDTGPTSGPSAANRQ